MIGTAGSSVMNTRGKSDNPNFYHLIQQKHNQGFSKLMLMEKEVIHTYVCVCVYMYHAIDHLAARRKFSAYKKGLFSIFVMS